MPHMFHVESLAHLVGLEIDHHENLADFLDRDGVAGKRCVLHHLPELVGLNGEGATNTLAWCEAVVAENAQDDVVEWGDDLLHLRTTTETINVLGSGCLMISTRARATLQKSGNF